MTRKLFMRFEARAERYTVTLAQTAYTPLGKADRRRWSARWDVLESIGRDLVITRKFIHKRSEPKCVFVLQKSHATATDGAPTILSPYGAQRRLFTEIRRRFEEEAITDVGLVWESETGQRRVVLPRRQKLHSKDFSATKDIQLAFQRGEIKEARAVRLLMTLVNRRSYVLKRGAYRALRKYMVKA